MTGRDAHATPRAPGGRPAAPGSERPTIGDVAREAGVSKATVSRALSGAPYVSEGTRDRVISVAGRMGYHPSITAQSLTTGRSLVIGVVVSDIEIPFFTTVARAIQNVALQHGYLTLLGNSDELAEAEDGLVEAFAARMVDGLIVTPAVGSNTRLREIAASIPVVVVDRLVDGLEVDAVLSANREGAREATDYLLRLGHQRIAYVTDEPDKTSSSERLAGFLDAFAAAGLTPDPDLSWVVDYHAAAAQRRVRDLLGRHRPTALLASEGSITLGSLRAAQELEIPIPARLSIIGFDQLDWGSATTPPITVVSQDAPRIGATAARLLLRRLTGSGAARSRSAARARIATALVERASCAPPAPVTRGG